jgi:hypothetical protein
MSPNGHPFHGCCLEQSDNEAAQYTVLPGQTNDPVDPLGQAGAVEEEQEVWQVPSKQRLLPVGQGKTGVLGIPGATQRMIT